MTEVLEKYLGLHERFEVLYVVDSWKAMFYEADGEVLLISNYGETIAHAIVGLERQLINYGTTRLPNELPRNT